MSGQPDPTRPVRAAARGLSLLIPVVAVAFLASPVSAQEGRTTFDDHVKAILRQHCSACHSPTKKTSDLDVSSYTSLMMGGSSGTVVEPGDADGSYLFSLVTHEEEPVMPPGGKIPDDAIETIRKWINDGAPESQGSKVTIKKSKAMAATADPLSRPENIATWPRVPLQPIQQTQQAPAIQSIATSPWLPVVAVAGQNQVLLYDTSTLQLTGVLPFPEGTVNVVRFSRNGSVLLAAGGTHGNQGVAVLWDVATGERIGSFGDELDSVLAADISSDHLHIALGGPGRVVNVYSTATGELEYSIAKHTDWVTALEFSVDGVLLASGDRNGGLFVFEAFTGREYLTLKGPEQAIRDISWRSDSNVVASASDDSTIRLWEMNNGGQIKSWNGHAGGTTSLEYLRDGRLVSTGDDRVTRLWNADGAQALEFSAFDDIALAVTWCHESSRAIAGDFTGRIRVWSGTDASLAGELSPNPPTLEQRIAAATEIVNQKTTELEPIQLHLQTASEAAKQSEATLETVKGELAAASQTLAELQASMAAASEKQVQSSTGMQQMQSSLDARATARGLVDESLVKLRQALESLPGDEALTAQADGLAARVAQFDAEIGDLNGQIAALKAAAEESVSQVVATNEKVTTQQTVVQALTTRMDQAAAEFVPLAAQRDEMAGQVAGIQASLETARAELARWTGEVAFIEQLVQLDQRKNAAEEFASEHQAKLDAANLALAEAQAVADAAQAEVTEARQSVEEIESEIRVLRNIQH